MDQKECSRAREGAAAVSFLTSPLAMNVFQSASLPAGRRIGGGRGRPAASPCYTLNWALARTGEKMDFTLMVRGEELSGLKYSTNDLQSWVLGTKKGDDLAVIALDIPGTEVTQNALFGRRRLGCHKCLGCQFGVVQPTNNTRNENTQHSIRPPSARLALPQGARGDQAAQPPRVVQAARFRLVRADESERSSSPRSHHGVNGPERCIGYRRSGQGLGRGQSSSRCGKMVHKQAWITVRLPRRTCSSTPRPQCLGVQEPEARQKLADGGARHERNHRIRFPTFLRPEGCARNSVPSGAPAGAPTCTGCRPVVPVASLLSPPANFWRAPGSLRDHRFLFHS